MPIQITCSCGRPLRVKDEVAGKRARCPGCGKILLVPEPQTSQNADDEAASFFMTEPDPDMSPSKPTGAVAHSDPADESIRPARKPTISPAPPSKATVSPRSKRKPRREESERPGFAIAIHPSIIIGVLMMIGAAVWFFLGLAANRIFFYPPVLFLLGIGSIIRGFKGED